MGVFPGCSSKGPQKDVDDGDRRWPARNELKRIRAVEERVCSSRVALDDVPPVRRRFWLWSRDFGPAMDDRHYRHPMEIYPPKRAHRCSTDLELGRQGVPHTHPATSALGPRRCAVAAPSSAAPCAARGRRSAACTAGRRCRSTASRCIRRSGRKRAPCWAEGERDGAGGRRESLRKTSRDSAEVCERAARADAGGPVLSASALRAHARTTRTRAHARARREHAHTRTARAGACRPPACVRHLTSRPWRTPLGMREGASHAHGAAARRPVHPPAAHARRWPHVPRACHARATRAPRED